MTLVAAQARPADPEPTSRSLRRDTVPPSIALRAPAHGARYAQGARVVADYSCPGAQRCTGTVRSGTAIDTTSPGDGAFIVRAVDDAGNASRASATSTVVPPPAPPSPAAAASAARPPALVPRLAPPAPAASPERTPVTIAAARLRPAARARVTTRRPVLRWRPSPGARLYNVQVFVLRGTGVAKVLSAFPAAARPRVRKGSLAFGNRSIWRVWTYRSDGYEARPRGQSFFDLRRPVRLTPAQLLVNQRIAQAAVRRVDAVARWLDEGLAAGDIRDGSLTAADFAAGQVTVTGRGTPLLHGLAQPRPLVVAAPRRHRAGMRADRRQLLINQRISQAALRRANALERRLAAGLTGGDLRPGAVTGVKLAPGLRIAATRPGVSPAPSALAVPGRARRPGTAAAVRTTDRQALVNQRISQAALRRANRLRALVERGLGGAQLRDGSIGARAVAGAPGARR